MRREAFFRTGEGVDLHFLDWGGTGKPIVLLAGNGGTAQVFGGLAPRLATNFRILALTRRGHGRSSIPESGYDLETLVRDIIHFLDHMGLATAYLIGHSFAGYEMTRQARQLLRLCVM